MQHGSSEFPQRAAHGLEGLIEVVQRLSLARDVDAVREIVRHAARELTGADGATFVLRDGDLCHYVDEDAIAPLWKGLRFPMSACISGWAMLHREPAVIEDIYVDPRIPVDAYRPTFVKSLVMVPIRTASPVGAIGNYWAERHRAEPGEVQLLQALADSTSIAMENVKLYAELERRVAERTAQLVAANEELEAFSYSVSHDLRTPLRAMDGFSQALLEDYPERLGPRGADYLQRIRRASQRMAELIDALLSLARVSRAGLSVEKVDLSSLAEQVAADLRRTEPDRAVELAIEGGLTAEGDPRLLRTALQNLLGNAWKFTANRADARIELSADGRRGDRQVFAVRDNGAGFDPRHADKLFGAFQRLHAEKEFTGTGIGLATVRRVIHRHGGEVWAAGAPERGATFYFTL